MQRTISLLILFTTLSLLGFSQFATIRGFVYEVETGEPVLFTNVFLRGTQYGSTTDGNGYFIINRIPAGNYSHANQSMVSFSSLFSISLKTKKQFSNILLLILVVVHLCSFPQIMLKISHFKLYIKEKSVKIQESY